jgi:glycosyltransferase involved in cell wall biosynthesis
VSWLIGEFEGAGMAKHVRTHAEWHLRGLPEPRNHSAEADLTYQGVDMTVSVVVCTFNYGHFVIEAINSVLAQTCVPEEIIVVDDGSTDNTHEVLKQHFSDHPRLRMLRQRNGGQLSAFVLGLQHCTGDIVFFLDADDKYDKNHINQVQMAFRAHPDVDFIFTGHRLFGESEGVVQYAPEDVNLGFSLITTLLNLTYVGSVTSTIAIRRNVILLLLPTMGQVAPRWRIRADDCLVYGASLVCSKKYFLASPTVLYRVHGKNGLFGLEENSDERFLHHFRRETFVQLLSTNLGIGLAVCLRVVQEFLSMEYPTQSDFRTYSTINRKLKLSLLTKLKGHIKMYLHYNRRRPHWDKSV